MLHIVPEAVEVPGRCALSLTTTGPFWDTQVTIPRHGRLYVSLTYLNGVADELGFASAVELHDAIDQLAAATTLADTLQARVERFDEDVQNVCDALISFLAITKNSDAVVDELKAAREAVAMLEERITTLEAQ